jgi:hypothetical protein
MRSSSFRGIIWLRMAGTLPVTAQSPRATTSLLRCRMSRTLFQVFLRADGAFDQDHIHRLGELLRVHQRAVNHLDRAWRWR